MPSTGWNAATGVVAVAVLLYMVIVAGTFLSGVLAAVAVALAGLLLGDVVDEGYPSELGRKGTLLTLAACAFVVGYFVVVATQILLGVLVAAGLFATVWAASYVRHHGYPASLGRRRSLATALAVTLCLLYATFVAGNLLLGVVAGLLVGLTAWLTSPTGPLLDDG